MNATLDLNNDISESKKKNVSFVLVLVCGANQRGSIWHKATPDHDDTWIQKDPTYDKGKVNATEYFLSKNKPEFIIFSPK